MQKTCPFETYKLYQAVKLHFTSEKYDYFKFHGKTNSTVKSFENRNDKSFFIRLSKLYDKNELTYLFYYSINVSSQVWIGDMLNPNHIDNFNKWYGDYFNNPSIKFNNLLQDLTSCWTFSIDYCIDPKYLIAQCDTGRVDWDVVDMLVIAIPRYYNLLKRVYTDVYHVQKIDLIQKRIPFLLSKIKREDIIKTLHQARKRSQDYDLARINK
jgi:hypothetical protein